MRFPLLGESLFPTLAIRAHSLSRSLSLFQQQQWTFVVFSLSIFVIHALASCHSVSVRVSVYRASVNNIAATFFNLAF